jgi:hypothetical protein
MDCDATYLGQASPLLNFIGFLIFSAVALWVTGGSGAGGHHRRVLTADMVRRAMHRNFLATCRSDLSRPTFGGGRT